MELEGLTRGLEMYAVAVAKGADLENKSVDVSLKGFDVEQIAYWRKFNRLHGWMNELYLSKGGKSQEFNLDTVEITEADLANLEEAFEAGLPPTHRFRHTPGFFFGGDEVYPEDIEGTKAFIDNARDFLKRGERVFYYGWW